MSQAERLKRLSEILIELFRSPIPTHFFQTLGDHAGSAVPHDYIAVCLVDPEKGSYLVHTIAGLDAGAVSLRSFSLYEGLPGRAMTTGQPQRIDDLALVRDGVHDLEGVLISAGLRATLVFRSVGDSTSSVPCCSRADRRSRTGTTTRRWRPCWRRGSQPRSRRPRRIRLSPTSG
jgi:hypothetical protein